MLIKENIDSTYIQLVPRIQLELIYVTQVSDILKMQSPVMCPICESPQARSLFLVKGADVVECRHCSMIYVPTPVPEHTSILEDYRHYRGEFTSHLVTFSKRLEDSEKILGHQGRLLDVGCALGHLGEAARRRGWDVYVTDVSEFAVLESRKKFGLNGFISSPHKLSVKPARFDLITMNDVVEHLSHPLELLRDVKMALSSRGLLHVTTPNVNSFWSRIMGKNWFHLRPNEHWLYFSKETLRSVLERSGFEVIQIKPVSRYMRLTDIFSRLERYSRGSADFLRRLVRLMGLSDIRLRIYVGEMQAWARPAHIREVTPTEPVKDIHDIVCCSNCKSDIQLFEESEAICTQCELSFEVKEGVINFSKYAKRGKQKVVGSS
jgi:2-polyprenyl-3-methyl-5-hydroxy-6-metoxy-1,4-benzoquinol methylase